MNKNRGRSGQKRAGRRPRTRGVGRASCPGRRRRAILLRRGTMMTVIPLRAGTVGCATVCDFARSPSAFPATLFCLSSTTRRRRTPRLASGVVNLAAYLSISAAVRHQDTCRSDPSRYSAFWTLQVCLGHRNIRARQWSGKTAGDTMLFGTGPGRRSASQAVDGKEVRGPILNANQHPSGLAAYLPMSGNRPTHAIAGNSSAITSRVEGVCRRRKRAIASSTQAASPLASGCADRRSSRAPPWRCG
jgi:hypothetical protein